MKYFKNEGFFFLLGDFLSIGFIRLILYLYPINPKIGTIYLHHAYFGLLGLILSSILLAYFVSNRYLRYFFSLTFGASFGAIIDEFNLFIINGGGFIYGGNITLELDIVALISGFCLYIIYLLKHK